MKSISPLLTALCLFSLAALGQVIPGYRGQWNDWGHTPMTLAGGAWRVTIQAPSGGTDFKIAPADWPDGDWTSGGLVPLATPAHLNPGSGQPDSSLSATPGRHYTFSVFDRPSFSVTNSLIVQETTSALVTILDVSHTTTASNAVVSIKTSATPGEETLYVRHSTNNWVGSSFAAASGSGTNWSVILDHPATATTLTNRYYALTTTVTTPTHSLAVLQALRFHDNGGANYAYVIDANGSGGNTNPPATNGVVYINEVVSSNLTGERDEDGDLNDWIELYNADTNAVLLTGWGLSDNAASPFKWVFGENVVIEPGEFLFIWSSDKNRPAITNGNQLHTSYGISSGGEAVVLTRPDGTRMDYFDPLVIPADHSLGRQPDGTGPLYFFAMPTPRASNTTTGILPPSDPPSFSVPAGLYTSNLTVAITSPVTGAVIRYTLDGSEPTTNSPVYTTPLNLGSKAGTPNNLSEIPTNNDPEPGAPYYEGWQPPASEVFKFHTVCARVFADGASPSLSATRSYVIDAAGANRYTLPVVSLVTDAANFFDPDIGIYVPGNFNNMFQSGSAWERPGTIEFFESDGSLAFTGNVGLRLHGNTTRSRPRKAIRVYARNPTSFAYQIYPDKPLARFDTFILRNGGNDWGQGVMRDLYAQSLIEGSTLDRQYGRPVLVFLNGEYWGLHDLRERFDEGYIQNNYGLNAAEYAQVEMDPGLSTRTLYDSGNEEVAADYNAIIDLVTTQSLVATVNYEAIADRIDLDTFIDFFQINIFGANTDWPGNNTRIWRSVATNNVEGAPVTHDARWRYMLYDMDFAFGLNFNYVPGNESYTNNVFGVFAQHDTLAHASSSSQTDFSNHPDATILFRRLLENDAFSQEFVTRFSDRLNTSFSRVHVTNRLAQWVAIFDPEMTEHVNRWRQPTDWSSELARIRSFGEQRTAAVWNQLQNKFSFAAPQQITLETVPTQGVVRINTTLLATNTPGFYGYPWTGSYFSEYPVTLTAEPCPGFRFVEWVSTSSSNTVAATDTRSNYSSWSSGSNQGSGFDNWILNPDESDGNRGYFLADSGWALYANSGGFIEATRPFSAPLATGQTFSVRMQHGNVDNGSRVGVSLQNAAGQKLFELFRLGGDSTYWINDATSAISIVSGPIDIEVTLIGPTNFSARINANGTPHMIDGALIAQGDATITRFRAWNYSAGGGSEYDFTFNDLSLYTSANATTQSLGTNTTISVNLTGATTIEAVFEPTGEAQPELVHYWNFNDITNQLAPVYSLVNGSGIAIALAPAGQAVSDTGQDFAAENARLGDAAGAHLRMNNPIGSVLDIALPTTGYENPVAKYESRRSGSGSREQLVSYTLDGVIYHAVETLIMTEVPTVYTFDFSAIPGANNNPFFGLRVEFAIGVGGGTGGNNRFDNLTLDATPLPEVTIPVLTPGGNANWNTGGNWTGGAFPNASGAAAIINAAIGSNRAVGITTPITVGSLLVDNAASIYRNRINGASPLTFANPGGVAALTINGTTNGFVEFEVTGGTVLATNLNITVNNVIGDAEFGALRLRQAWTGPGGLRKFGPGMASLTGEAKSYSGATTIKQGVLAVSQPSTMTNGNGVTVLPGGQLRLTSATDELGPRTYAFGGTISLNSMGRSGVSEGANLGVLGALRYEPGTTNSKAIVTTPVVLAGNADLHVATASNELELSGPLSGSGAITKSGGGRLILSGAGNAYTSAIAVITGGLRVDTALGSAIALAAGTELGGAGAVGAISGTGTVAPGGILSAQSASGLNYAFVFTRTGMPVFAQTAASENDLLRLRSASAPFIAPLTAGSQINLYLDVPSASAGGVFGGGFFADLRDDFIASLTNATTMLYIADAAGTVTNNGQTYRTYDLANAWSLETADVVADFAGGTTTGRITQLRIAVGATGFDGWRGGNFTEQELADPAISGPYADPANSGVANLYRYATGLDRDEDPRPGLPQVRRSDAEQNLFIYRRLSADNPGVDYVIELNSNLMQSNGWRAAVMGSELIEEQVIDNQDGQTENVEVGIPDQTVGDGIHLRLKIQPE